MSKSFIVRTPLSYPVDKATVDALLQAAAQGDGVAAAAVDAAQVAGKMRVAVEGEIVDDIPAVSVEWLLEQGCIEPVMVAAPVTHTTADETQDAEDDGLNG